MSQRGSKERICEMCNSLFKTYNSNKGRFCSRSCYNDHHKTKPKTCKSCSESFVLPGQPNQDYCSRECYYRETEPWNKGLRDAQPKLLGKNHPGIKKKMAQLGLSWEEFNNWRESRDRYYAEVWRITNQQPIETLTNSDKPRGRSGVDGAYQLDHIIPISEGFEKKIDPVIIGSITNLQFISWEDNLKKRYKHL